MTAPSPACFRKVIVFGAGASHGAAPEGQLIPGPPPLGDGLFVELERHFPSSWGSLSDDLKDNFRAAGGFEPAMKRVYDEMPTAVAILMQHMALYFVQFRPAPGATTLYDRLIGTIQELGLAEDVVLATLNYECLLDMAVWRAGLAVNLGTDRPDQPHISVWKLHGACNLVAREVRASRGVTYTQGVSFAANFDALSLNDAIAYCLGDNGLPPVMCLFMEGKPSSVATHSIGALWAAWSDVVANAESVVLVGVQPHPVDQHIWAPLAATSAALTCIGGRGGAAAFEEWVNQSGRTGMSRGIPSYFDASFDIVVEELSRRTNVT